MKIEKTDKKMWLCLDDILACFLLKYLVGSPWPCYSCLSSSYETSPWGKLLIPWAKFRIIKLYIVCPVYNNLVLKSPREYIYQVIFLI